jgi:hypothetical protein
LRNLPPCWHTHRSRGRTKTVKAQATTKPAETTVRAAARIHRTCLPSLRRPKPIPYRAFSRPPPGRQPCPWHADASPGPWPWLLPSFSTFPPFPSAAEAEGRIRWAEGGARDARRFSMGHGRLLEKSPPAPRTRSEAQGARAGRAFFDYFPCTSKESDCRPQDTKALALRRPETLNLRSFKAQNLPRFERCPFARARPNAGNCPAKIRRIPAAPA